MAGSENGHNILFGTLMRREQYAQAVEQWKPARMAI